MDLLAEISAEHSRSQSARIAGWIGGKPARLEQLIGLFLHGDRQTVQRSAWILRFVSDSHPGLITPFLPQMIDKMRESGVHVAVKRNVLAILQTRDIPESLHATLMNTCFDFLSDPTEAVAVRCFSMTVLANLAQTYPDLGQELSVLVADILEHETSAGLKARSKRTLKEISQAAQT